MKTFGRNTIILTCGIIAILVVTLFLLPSDSGLQLALALPMSFALAQLANMPLISIDKQRMAIFTLNPFHKNIRVNFTDVRKIIITVNSHTLRAVLLMKDGSERSTLSSRYHSDMKPLYDALVASGVLVETHGVGTINWT